MKLQHQIAPVYARFFPRALLELDPSEPKATCAACAMAPGRHRGKYTYRADLKCCTFQPWLPNFAVGGLLAETDEKSASVREQLRGFIETRRYSLPIGMVPTVRYQVEFNTRAPEDFGNREDLLCPYYDHGTELCRLWRYRGSVCTTFHCKTIHKSSGKAFWKKLEGYLSFTEMALMEDALVHLDFSPRQISDLLGYINRQGGTAAELKSNVLPEKKARELWNGYFDDQEGFFKKCLAHVESFDRMRFEELIGEQGEFIEVDLLLATNIWR